MIYDISKVGSALKTLLNRLKDSDFFEKTEISSCDTYGCLECKHYQRREVYNQQWGMFQFGQFKCKKQPDRNMMFHDNHYYDKSKGDCPYFERGENELIYMTEKEKRKYI